MNCALLVDGTMLSGLASWSTLRDATSAVSLYADLGEIAGGVGPWLIPGKSLQDLNAAGLALPARLGVSELLFRVSLVDLNEHLQGLRHVETSDGQRYFLRYADMRAIGALLIALDASPQRRLLFGPLSGWRHFDRDGELRDWVRSDSSYRPSGSKAQPRGVRLDDMQLSRLLDAMLADRLSSALEELGESGLNPHADARQYAHVCAAAVWLQRESVDSFPTQRAVAQRSVETQGACLEDTRFSLAVQRALQRPHREYEVLCGVATNSQAGGMA